MFDIKKTLLLLSVVASLLWVGPVDAQKATIDLQSESVETKQLGDLAEGPYDRLVIRDVMVIPGYGGPPNGPYDILIEGNVISEIQQHDPEDEMKGDRVIEGEGRFVMPGMINLHLHLRGEWLPLRYSYLMQLATGVTILGPAESERVQDDLEPIRNNGILAPRLFPIYGWGSKTDYSEEELRDPSMAPEIAEEMVQNGARQVYINGLTWNQELFGAAATAVEEAGGLTAVHIQPSSTSVVDAVDAARLGVTMIVHHYGYAESALDGIQDYPRDYDYNNENKRFREAAKVWVDVGKNPETRERLLNEVVDSLVSYGVIMQPNRATYEANRDVIRAQGLPWHEKYTHQALWEHHLPSPDNHAVFHYNWTNDDEYYWNYMYDLWGDLIYEFNKEGGMVAFGTDDNYQWSTGGFGNIRELQLLRESGMHNLAVLRTANQNSARVLEEPNLGLVKEGYVADLLVVDGNPAKNFRYLYPFGAVKMNEEGERYRTEGIVHTIKDGVVIENDLVMEEIAEMVAESKEDAEPYFVNRPFLPYPDWMSEEP
jgi:hypothetical protein